MPPSRRSSDRDRNADRLDKIEGHISDLLIIAENHTVQIGLMMKAALAVVCLTMMSVLGTILYKVLALKIVGG